MSDPPVPAPTAALVDIAGLPVREPGRGRRAVALAALVRTVLDLPDDVVVAVQQLACREPGCPPVETVLAVLGTPPRRWAIRRPLAEIDDDLVADLLTHDPQGDPA